MAEAKKSSPAKLSTKVSEGKKAKKEAEVTAETVVENEAQEVKVETEVVAEPKATAKAGKRSVKAVKEAKEKEAKEAHKSDAPAEKTAPKAKNPTRSREERAGKKYRELAKLVDKEKVYALDEALELAVKTSPVKFDASVELHVNLGVDPKQADQNVRDMVLLPAGTGKTVRVAAFVEADDVAKAKSAGADIAGTDNLLAELDKENINFDILVATPTLMARLGKYARLLGPRGLMPNPKSGTVTTDVAAAIKAAKAGRVEYRVDQAGIIHLGIGKVSFGKDKLAQNAQAVIASIKAAKPASLKGVYVKNAHITTSMGPSIKTELGN